MTDQFSSVKKVLIVDDHILFREGLTSLFRSTSDFQVVDEAGSVKEGIEKAFAHRPDIILMDFSLPDGTGLDATFSILRKLPDTRIVFLTVYEADAKLFAAIRLGAKGYMLKNISSSSLLASLRALDQGELAMSRKMLSKVIEALHPSAMAQDNSLLNKLSQREMEILYELGSGASNADIARKLYLSENTVKHHVHSILEKLGVDNRHQAGEFADETDPNSWQGR